MKNNANAVSARYDGNRSTNNVFLISKPRIISTKKVKGIKFDTGRM